MYPQLDSYIEKLGEAEEEISAERKQKLGEIADYIHSADSPRLVFICTHNSRRSHLCQVWAATAADYCGLDHVETYSGGTESTAFNPRAVRALEKAGFRIEDPGGKNPRYEVRYCEEAKPLICFSKTFDDPANPRRNFAAVMTCSDADENCPIVPGAVNRFSIPYVDPKKYDGTPQEAATYDKRCLQIANEMFYMMSRV